MSWGHQFYDDAVAITANVAGGWQFVTPGVRPALNSALITSGVNWKTSNNMALTATYSGEIKDEYVGHGGLVQLRMGF